MWQRLENEDAELSFLRNAGISLQGVTFFKKFNLSKNVVCIGLGV